VPSVNSNVAWRAPEQAAPAQRAMARSESRNPIRNKLHAVDQAERRPEMARRAAGQPAELERRRTADAGSEEGGAVKQSREDLRIHFLICCRSNRMRSQRCRATGEKNSCTLGGSQKAGRTVGRWGNVARERRVLGCGSGERMMNGEAVRGLSI
jgi:hypothetical protein